MRINIKGNDITPDKIALAIEACEREYGLKIKGATLYLRFENDMGQTVEPLINGEEFSRTFAFWKPKEVNGSHPVQRTPDKKPNASTPITARDMINLCKDRARRSLSDGEMKTLIELAKSTGVDRETFQYYLDQTIAKTGRFNSSYLTSMIYDLK